MEYPIKYCILCNVIMNVITVFGKPTYECPVCKRRVIITEELLAQIEAENE